MYAKWNGKKHKLLDSAEINKSSREVTYSDIKVDFINQTIEDLPLYLQEIQIISNKGNLLFTGYVENCTLPTLKDIEGLERELQISLLTPRAITTKRTVTVVATGKTRDILNLILSPLYEDEFFINEYNVQDRIITVKFISKTIEECLNILSNKLSLYWNIDELKGISINDIEYQFSKQAETININNYKEKIKGFISLTPSVSGYDYANIINIKNARIFYSQENLTQITLNKGDKYEFENPIDISFNTAKRVLGNSIFIENETMVLDNLCISYGNNQEAYIRSGFNTSGQYNNGINIRNISTDDKSGSLFVLELDSIFKNLATGFTYKRRKSNNSNAYI